MISTTDHPLEKRKFRCERATHNYMNTVAEKESTAIRTLHKNKITIKVKTIGQAKDLYCSIVCFLDLCAQEDTLLYRILFDQVQICNGQNHAITPFSP